MQVMSLTCTVHVPLKLGGCNNEMAALQSHHYTEVPLQLHRKATEHYQEQLN